MEPGVKQDILEGYKEAVLEFHGLCRQFSELRTKRDEAGKRLAEITELLERHIKANLKDPTSVSEVPEFREMNGDGSYVRGGRWT